MPTISPFVMITRGDCFDERNSPTGWPDSSTSVCSSVNASRYFLMSRYCIQFWHTWPVSPYVTSSYGYKATSKSKLLSIMTWNALPSMQLPL